MTGRLSQAVVDCISAAVGVMGYDTGLFWLYFARGRVIFFSAAPRDVGEEVFTRSCSILVLFSILFNASGNIGVFYLPLPNFNV